MRNTQTPFHASFLAFSTPSHPTLRNHEAPKPILPTPLLGTMSPPHSSEPFPPHSWEPWSTQIPFHASFLAGPFPPHSWEPWRTQPLFHASFLAFSNHSHNILGNHCEPSQALPTPFLWAMKQPTPVFVLHFWLPQAHPTPRMVTKASR